jgi:hypothetical protein
MVHHNLKTVVGFEFTRDNQETPLLAGHLGHSLHVRDRGSEAAGWRRTSCTSTRSWDRSQPLSWLR